MCVCLINDRKGVKPWFTNYHQYHYYVNSITVIERFPITTSHICHLFTIYLVKGKHIRNISLVSLCLCAYIFDDFEFRKSFFYLFVYHLVNLLS